MAPPSSTASAPPREYEHSDYRQAHSVDEVTEQNAEAMARLESSYKADRSFSDRVADAIAAFCGSMTFVWVHVVFFTVWIGMNTLPGLPHIDPFPFIFLTLVVSLEAIFLSTFILISQNQAARLSERRNEIDLQINLLTEQENTKVLRLLRGIAKAVGADIDEERAIAALEQATRPEKLIDQIERANEREAQLRGESDPA